VPSGGAEYTPDCPLGAARCSRGLGHPARRPAGPMQVMWASWLPPPWVVVEGRWTKASRWCSPEGEVLVGYSPGAPLMIRAERVAVDCVDVASLVCYERPLGNCKSRPKI
jgi:hypothetical protein